MRNYKLCSGVSYQVRDTGLRTIKIFTNNTPKPHSCTINLFPPLLNRCIFTCNFGCWPSTMATN